MKKLLIACIALALIVCVGAAHAKRPGQPHEVNPDLPIIISITVIMPDGSVETFDLPTSNIEITTDGPIYKSVMIIPPPLTFFQLGWFVYFDVPFFGWRGPNGFDHIMTIDPSGIRHAWVWVGYWAYLGTF